MSSNPVSLADHIYHIIKYNMLVYHCNVCSCYVKVLTAVQWGWLGNVCFTAGGSYGEGIVWDGSFQESLYHILRWDWCNRRYSLLIQDDFYFNGITFMLRLTPTQHLFLYEYLCMYFIKGLGILDEIIIGSEQASRQCYRLVYKTAAY